jgi:hypothetical protein
VLSDPPTDRRDDLDDWTVVVPTRGNATSAVRIGENVAGRLDGVPVVVVRNGAVSGEAEWASLARLPHVELVDRPGGGVARARNAALTTATARTVIFVDDDVVVSGSALRTLVARQRAEEATIATARVVPADAPHHRLFDADLGFDRGRSSGVWRAGTGQGAPLSPLNAWQFGVGATFAVDLHLLRARGDAVRFDERLSNGQFCGGSEDVDFFYAAYLLGHTVSYVAEAVVEHLFPMSAAAVSAKCRQYALTDGAFYAKWARRFSAADLGREFSGWADRMVKHAADRAHGRPAVPLADLLAEPLYKLVGGVSWALILRRSC